MPSVLNNFVSKTLLDCFELIHMEQFVNHIFSCTSSIHY